jgi:hypothetical protein
MGSIYVLEPIDCFNISVREVCVIDKNKGHTDRSVASRCETMCSEATQNIQQSHDFYFPCSFVEIRKKRKPANKENKTKKQCKVSQSGGSGCAGSSFH